METLEKTRRLATIRTIAKIEPIEGADAIELATVDGWQCVVSKKENFKVGDLCVYLEIDSVLPKENPAFAFMERHNYRVKTMKLRGQISQGLALPVSILPNALTDNPEFNKPDSTGLDLTEWLGIVKYERAVHYSLAGMAKGAFPSFVPKTDEERIQNCWAAVSLFFGEDWEATEKLDGSSMTIYFKDDVFGVCSRNLDLKLEGNEGNAFVAYALKHQLEKRLRDHVNAWGGGIAIQGELIGPGIQKNRYERKEHEFRVFSVYDTERGRYSDQGAAQLLANSLGFLYCPTVWQGKLGRTAGRTADGQSVRQVPDLVAMATRKSELNPKVEMEGLVFRPLRERYVHRFGRLSFKVINPQFLLKGGE